MNMPPSPPLKTLELRQLRYFSVLARELHFGRAAEAVYVTQPALSQQIAKLEELVGAPLFVRESRGVTLTPAGAALRDGIEQVFAQLNMALRAARDAGERRAFTLSVGLVEYTNLPFIPPALIRLQALYPDVNIVRHEMNAKRQLAALATDEIDVGLRRTCRATRPEGAHRLRTPAGLRMVSADAPRSSIRTTQASADRRARG